MEASEHRANPIPSLAKLNEPPVTSLLQHLETHKRSIGRTSGHSYTNGMSSDVSNNNRPIIHGRGAAVQPDNPYLSTQRVDDWEHVAEDEEYLQSLGRPPTVYLDDNSQTIVATNDSPDVGFNYSVNPYRGCAHGCSYCFA